MDIIGDPLQLKESKEVNVCAPANTLQAFDYKALSPVDRLRVKASLDLIFNHIFSQPGFENAGLPVEKK